MIESLQGRLIFGRPKRIRALAPGPHAGTYLTTPHRIERPDGAVLEGWSSSPVDGRPHGVVLYFGGRNEHVAWAADMASFVPRHAIYAFNYRGFGGSTGAPSEQRAKRDAQAIHAFVASRESASGCVLVGRSLGTSLALWLARDAQPERLVLLSPFESVAHVLSGRPFGRIAAPFVSQRFDCTGLARACASETLVLLAEHDRAIPHAQSLQLGARLAKRPAIQIVAGTTHQSLPRSAGAQAAIAAFLAAGTAARHAAGAQWPSTLSPRSA